jgi:hypothetical protein
MYVVANEALQRRLLARVCSGASGADHEAVVAGIECLKAAPDVAVGDRDVVDNDRNELAVVTGGDWVNWLASLQPQPQLFAAESKS